MAGEQSPYSPTPQQFGPGPQKFGGGPQKPGKVTAIAIMTLIGGIYALIFGLSLILGCAAGTVCIGLLWIPMYLTIVLGIMAIIKGSKLLGQNDRYEKAPYPTAIMQIVNIINFDVVNCVLGIVILVFLSDPEVKAYYQG
jgi:hypothetical protein